MAPKVIRPQPGPQEKFLSTPADICVYGGAAGGGKTWGLLLEPLRHVANSRFNAVFFRRESTQIRNVGGLWDESVELYPLLGATSREAVLEWRFPSGAEVHFRHLQHESDKQSFQGSQIALVAFDELTHFTESQFWYLLSRNRSVSGVRPYVRATCNPDPLSWVKPFLAPWIDTEFPDPAGDGELRWMVRDGGLIRWVPQGTPDAKSVTFIRASVYDNRILLEKNPEYLSNLKALPLADRKALLEGSWDLVADGDFFSREWFEIVDAAPADAVRVRYWDLAATEESGSNDPDWTAGAKVALSKDGIWFIEDVVRTRSAPLGVEKLIRQTAELDGEKVEIFLEQEGGASGKTVVDRYVREVLRGFTARGEKPKTGKVERAKPVSAQAEAGNVKLVRGPWNSDFLNEAAAFPNSDFHDDQIDAVSGAFKRLAKPGPATVERRKNAGLARRQFA